MGPNIAAVKYVESKWDLLNAEVVSDRAIVCTIYDASCKALAYIAWGLPLIGTPLCLTLLAASIVIDAAIAKQWPNYIEAVRTTFNGTIRPSVASATKGISLNTIGQRVAAIYTRLAGS
jgi:hypothetical protein